MNIICDEFWSGYSYGTNTRGNFNSQVKLEDKALMKVANFVVNETCKEVSDLPDGCLYSLPHSTKLAIKTRHTEKWPAELRELILRYLSERINEEIRLPYKEGELSRIKVLYVENK